MMGSCLQLLLSHPTWPGESTPYDVRSTWGKGFLGTIRTRETRAASARDDLRSLWPVAARVQKSIHVLKACSYSCVDCARNPAIMESGRKMIGSAETEGRGDRARRGGGSAGRSAMVAVDSSPC